MPLPSNWPKNWMPWLLGGAGTIALVSGMVISTQVKSGDQLDRLNPFGQNRLNSTTQGTRPNSAIAALLRQAPAQRADRLQTLAAAPQPSIDRSRARYLRATDLLNAQQPQLALPLLENLEAEYPVMATVIQHQRAKALSATKQVEPAKAIWQSVAQNAAQDPIAAEALYELGRSEPKYWDQVMAQFPTHPRAIAIAKARLQKNPKQLPLLLLLAKAEPDAKDTPARLDQLVQLFGPQLQPADWQTVAFAYWESQKYDKAAKAYAKTAQTPQTAYRSARGLHLSGEPGGQQRYEMVVKQFPGTPEAGLALTRLAQLSEPPKAVPYLDLVLAQYPDRAPEALLEKAKLLDKMQSQQSATQTRQTLLEKFPKSQAAGDLRWTLAQQSAKTGDFKAAERWTSATLQANPLQDIGAKSGFWAGKWALKSGDATQAGKHFQQVIQQYPESYYAWRSASLLGWNVGDFATVRQLQPLIQQPGNHPQLMAGSPVLQELSDLGQWGDAWAHWQVEFTNRAQPTVPEQFTDGMLRLGVGDNLDAIFMLANLADREAPTDQKQYQTLKVQPDYWQGLYPFPFIPQITQWAAAHRLNPMLVTALMRQESRFEPKIKSSVGATGLMQLMPDTADFVADKLSMKTYNAENPDDNIKLGTWYLGYTHDEYQDNSMLAIASYNAGPNAVSGWLEKTKIKDTDEFVEAIPYDETQGYVRSVFGNYWNYLRLYNPEIAQKVSQVSPLQPKLSR
jgi:soluble lytic murein transglycosylase